MDRTRTDEETATNRQPDVEERSRRPDTGTEMDRQLEAARLVLVGV
jgi:hypothetical protein